MTGSTPHIETTLVNWILRDHSSTTADTWTGQAGTIEATPNILKWITNLKCGPGQTHLVKLMSWWRIKRFRKFCWSPMINLRTCWWIRTLRMGYLRMISNRRWRRYWAYWITSCWGMVSLNFKLLASAGLTLRIKTTQHRKAQSQRASPRLSNSF